jgi:uncharacterized membrane protein YgcG
MIKTARFLQFILAVATLLLSACGGAATPNTGGGKVEAMPVAFTGTVESIAGDQWVINGQTVTVDPAVVRDGPFNAGDQVKVEGVVNADGSFTVSRLETPSPEDLSTLPQFGNDNSNANSNDANSNAANVNDDNGNDANSNDANVNDDNSNTTVNGNDANSNDDNSNAANANDDNSNTGGNDNGGGGNDNGGGGNDDGGGGNDNGGSGNGG